MMQHHLSDPSDGYSMVWRQLIWFHNCQWHQFLFRFAIKVPDFWQRCHPKIGMAWHQWVSRSQKHDATSLIRSIWMIFNGLEATDLVS
jgi:hypothetical protein